MSQALGESGSVSLECRTKRGVLWFLSVGVLTMSDANLTTRTLSKSGSGEGSSEEER